MGMNFEDFAEATSLSLINMAEMIKKGKEEAELNAVNKSVELYDELKTGFSILKLDNELIRNELEETKLEFSEVKKEYSVLKDATYVLATDDGKCKTLTKLIKNMVFKKYTGTKKTLKYKLFQECITRACYGRIYAQFEINSYKRIRIEDFEEAIKVVNRFFANIQNITYTVEKKLKEYIADKHLSSEKSKLVEKFLVESNGGAKICY